MFGWINLWFRNSSLSRMIPLASSERLERWLQMKPVEIWCFAAVRRMFLNLASQTQQDEGGGSLKNLSSVSVFKCSHLALRMLAVWISGGSGNQSAKVMKIGRWSEFRVFLWVPGGTHCRV